MAPNDLKWAKNDLWAKDSEFLPNSAIETQKTQKFGVNSEIITPLEPLASTFIGINSEGPITKNIKQYSLLLLAIMNTRAVLG